MQIKLDTRRTNAKELIKFTFVGALSTAAHYVILFGLVELHVSEALIASMIGYSLGAFINYYLNLKYTFNSKTPHKKALPKFIVMIILGFTINGFVMYLMIYSISINYLFSQLVATIVVYCWNFIIGKLWAFK